MAPAPDIAGVEQMRSTGLTMSTALSMHLADLAENAIGDLADWEARLNEADSHLARFVSSLDSALEQLPERLRQ